ncbi:glycosyltransferase family A protein [Roseovarius sp. M141]|uniref:glycosyltransferase family 2 protein n=1 Tax=Roseovarius sp. M141 TaxID=2583806 RepID=UPI0020CBF5C8|nr:glycosyltransferase family A protein [Roseovarius sp. M141]MCQ0090857.1 glycosyltransferase family 2 protein [Roseovarius sp. M141]
MTSDLLAPLVDIVIPTYNRAHLIAGAIRAALEQSWWNIRVTVIDDASTDAIESAVQPFLSDPRFNYIRLSRNLGTANAKNAGLLLTAGDAITFHDSDDIPHRDKVLQQVRVLTAQDIGADDCLNWQLANKEAGQRLEVSAALTHHELILPDGRRVEIRRDLSLLDDVFPNLQMGAQVPGGMDTYQFGSLPFGCVPPPRRVRGLHRGGPGIPQPADPERRGHLDRSRTVADQDRDPGQPDAIRSLGLRQRQT